MSEFAEVIRQFNRMCNAHEGCTDCPLAATGQMSCSICDFIDNPGRIESNVMAWAAEHPEPVHPTWYDFLFDLWPCDENSFHEFIRNTPIPADIAQKLGIEPKEG